MLFQRSDVTQTKLGKKLKEKIEKWQTTNGGFSTLTFTHSPQ